MKNNVVIGITGGIAAYKIIDLVTFLQSKNLEVSVILTESAVPMVDLKKFKEAVGENLYTDLFPTSFDYKKVLKERHVDHIDVADNAHVIVIAPATANTIAKLTYGIADNFLTTTVLAATSPVIVCPSMNVNMWNNPVVQENIAILKRRGYQIIEPTSGMLACGYEGKGRLENLEIIQEEILKRLSYTQSLIGKKVIVTAGGTIEEIDDVRYISNRSSGKMGIALAEECYLRGADVLLLRSKYSVSPRFLMNEKIFTSAGDLFNLIQNNIKDTDIFFQVAAISDFYIDKTKGKITSSKKTVLTLSPRSKIINQLKNLNPHMILIAFKAEYSLSEEDLIKKAREKLKESQADLVVANDISKENSGFESDMNDIFIVSKKLDKVKHLSASKSELASHILSSTLDVGRS